MSTGIFKLDENTKNLIMEISALSGYSQSIVKECYEYLIINWAIKIADCEEREDKIADLAIPYLGTLNVKYTGDEVLPSGELDTHLEASVDFCQSFRKLFGDIVDQGHTELEPIIKKKIENAVTIASST